MNRVKIICRGLWSWALVLGCWLIVEGTLWAKDAEPAEEESSNTGAWVLPYFLVILCIGLGMLVVCRTSRRTDRARPQKYEALNTKN